MAISKKPVHKEMNNNMRKNKSVMKDDNVNKKNKLIFDKTNKTIFIVFCSLLMDLLAFTMILPLLPSLLDHYKINDDPNGCYKWFESSIKYFQQVLQAPERFNSVLFGGFLGSMFSFLQFLVSPLIGGLSDVYGRKPILLICLGGICFSYILWALSKTFSIFILARIIGGISKGNVSLSMAIIADVSSIASRGKGMALIGIAFSIGFIIGPVIGALFAKWSHSQHGNWFVFPAIFAFLLSFADFLFVIFYFKESLPKEKRAKSVAKSLSQATAYINFKDIFQFRAVKNINKKDLNSLQNLGFIYFVYLLVYSGLEFTLTFLTHHTFQYTSMEQGWMFFGIGLIMAILQSSWVRKLPHDKIKPVATLGLLLIIPSFVLIGLATTSNLLILGLLFFAISTAMVVSCMTTLASKFGPEDQKGTILGIFRSLGALARAIGPILASTAFWSVGSSVTYLTGAVVLIWPWFSLYRSQIS
ncbi:tetracycline-efflux transporter, putative [Pediculus humanus corporis]|uniref:Tetracycline-efflux transporter, putative n=1 Tax=Pediculus humanus subsp. corporis TaxID=121224 RepID=E0VPH8_PEDHC|nr:tetracycline-efflux transporter, putative [Pediculus humanus corporis]EEB15284.1 tetracycline-efflux transporter, putative [Pediculus humanus corporis]